jgi:hypothetical protein
MSVLTKMRTRTGLLLLLLLTSIRSMIAVSAPRLNNSWPIERDRKLAPPLHLNKTSQMGGRSLAWERISKFPYRRLSSFSRTSLQVPIEIASIADLGMPAPLQAGLNFSSRSILKRAAGSTAGEFDLSAAAGSRVLDGTSAMMYFCSSSSCSSCGSCGGCGGCDSCFGS